MVGPVVASIRHVSLNIRRLVFFGAYSLFNENCSRKNIFFVNYGVARVVQRRELFSHATRTVRGWYEGCVDVSRHRRKAIKNEMKNKGNETR